MNNLFIASVLLVMTLVIGACSQRVQSEQKGLPALKVTENHRFLVDEQGNPFFLLVNYAELISNAAESELLALSVTEVKKLYAGCKLALNTAAGYIIPKNTIPIG